MATWRIFPLLVSCCITFKDAIPSHYRIKYPKQKFKKLLLLLFACSLISFAHSQPLLDVKTFEYVWQENYTGIGSSTKRVIIAEDDSVKMLIRNSFSKALQQRWNVSMPGVSLSVKKSPVLSFRVKFKTDIKDKDPAKWYLFLKVSDMGSPFSYNLKGNELFTTLEIKCRLIDGKNDSMLVNKDLFVKIYKDDPPPDQAVLKRLSVYPISFIHSFDSIAAWLFTPDQFTERSLTLKPACEFHESAFKNDPVKILEFKNDKENIRLLSSPVIGFHPGDPSIKKTDSKRNFGANALSGALTLFTGLGTSKTRTFFYKADFPYDEENSTYHCAIHYAEEESKDVERVRNEDRSFTTESSDYAVAARHIKPDFEHMITVGNDTLATFNMEFSKKIITADRSDKMWDGSDSTTITFLPASWNNSNEFNLAITGTMLNDPFSMKMKGSAAIKEFYINGRLVMIVTGIDKPVKAFLFQPVSNQQLKLFTIFSSLPYNYFRPPLTGN